MENMIILFVPQLTFQYSLNKHFNQKTFIKMIAADEPPSFCFYSFSVFKPTNKCIYLHILRYIIANQYSFLQSCKCLSACACKGLVCMLYTMLNTSKKDMTWICLFDLISYIACKRITQFHWFLQLLLFQLTVALLQNVLQLCIVLSFGVVVHYIYAFIRQLKISWKITSSHFVFVYFKHCHLTSFSLCQGVELQQWEFV